MISRRDFSGLTDMYLDTSTYNLDPGFQNYFLQDPKELDQRRLYAYKYFMNFYKGRHWEETGEYNPAFGNRSFVEQEFNRRTWNVAANLIDKLVDFLVKEPWTIKLPPELEKDDAEDEGQKNPIQAQLEAVWEANDKMMFSYKMALMGCVTGDCFIRLSYDPDFYADGAGEIKLDVLDSRTVQPFWDSMQRDKMVGARIQYPVYELMDDGSRRTAIYREVHTDANIVYFLDEELQRVVPNPLGELLIIHIKNEPVAWERFGTSDLYPLILIQKEFNERVSDFSEILAYHAAPVTVIKGARIQQMEKGARKIWGGLPKDSTVENLNLDADLSSSLEFLKLLKTQIHETGSVPEEVLSNLEAISNTSGAALHLQYQPVVDRTQRKQTCYGTGLMTINRLIMRFYEATKVLEFPKDIPPALKYKTTIQWGDPLPHDRSIDLADISTEIGLGIESKRGALVRLGDENPDSKLEEIKQEMMEQAEMDFMTAGLGGFGDPHAGPDGMGGQPQTPGGPGDKGPGTKAGANVGPQNDVAGAVKQAKTNPITQGRGTSSQAVKKAAQTRPK